MWLELEQRDQDLQKAVTTAAFDKKLWPIPEPHCTVLYGISHMTEQEAKQCFRDKVVPLCNAQPWPAFKAKGAYNGVSFDGVDGEEMDMSWIELSLYSSPEHGALVDGVHSCFYSREDEEMDNTERTGPWHPHVSIAYDNPLGTVLDDLYTEKIFANYPSLLGQSSRDVVSISLWRTEGKLWDWVCLEKALLNKK